MSQHSKKVVDQLCNYLGYDFESPMCKELHEHVQNCPECQNYIKSVKLTVNMCKDAYKDVPVPEDVKKELLEKIRLKK
jgi:predicted anti-sigma-YlaC factor YlaD